jgi:hypothetical protein
MTSRVWQSPPKPPPPPRRIAGTPLDDAVAGYEASAWAGVGVPRGTRGEIIERLNREINAGLVKRGWPKSPLHQKSSLRWSFLCDSRD